MQNTLTQKSIDISFLPINAKKELISYYNYLLNKYVSNDNSIKNELDYTVIVEQKVENDLKNTMDKNEFLAFLKQGFTLSEVELNRIEENRKEINKWKIQKF